MPGHKLWVEPLADDRNGRRLLVGKCSTGAQRNLHGREQARRHASAPRRRAIDPELCVGIEEDRADHALMCDRQQADGPGRVDARLCAHARDQIAVEDLRPRRSVLPHWKRQIDRQHPLRIEASVDTGRR